jgi:hypothetical protein
MFEKVTDYTWPRSHPRSQLFRVRVDGDPMTVLETDIADFAVVALSGAAQVEVEIDTPVEQAVVRPLSRGYAADVAGSVCRFGLRGPDRISVEINRLKPLYLFVNAPEADAPDPDADGVHYYGAGQTHEVGELHLASGETLYIEGGAIVKGCVRAEEAADITIRGQGILDGSYYTKGVDSTRTILLSKCSGIAIRDLTIIRPTSWTIHLNVCSDIRVSNVKQIAWRLASDGVDIVSCRDVVVEDCFLRNGDDCVVVKARAPEDYPGYDTDVDNVLVQRCTLVNDGGGNATEIGYELRTPSVRNIVFRDCDILCVEGYGAAFGIHNGDRATVSNVLYEDIRVEHYFTFLIDFRIIASRYGRDEEHGQVRNVQLRNIRVMQSIYNAGYSVSLIGGMDAQHTIEGVTIQDLYLDDLKVTDPDELDLYVRNASGIEIR